jgi:hypothetical protein
MILGFKTKFPWGETTNFRVRILAGIKKTTIRKGNRWKPSMKIHFATGVRTKKYNQFAEGICIEACNILIEPTTKVVIISAFTSEGFLSKAFSGEILTSIAIDDGFDSVEDFWKYFNEPFEGQIISWKLTSPKIDT